MRLALVCFYCLCVFVYVLYFIATMSFAGYFLPVLFCMLSMLISDSRFDLVWFRLSCDHGWIRSGSVNVRKQQQQRTRPFADRSVASARARASAHPVTVSSFARNSRKASAEVDARSTSSDSLFSLGGGDGGGRGRMGGLQAIQR